MGEEAAEDHPLLSDPDIGMPGLANVAFDLAKRHGLEPSAELELLVDHLFGLSCRDQEEEHSDPVEMGIRRAEGFDLAKQMQAEASTILASLERLYAAYLRFNNEVVRYNPALLEAVFDVDLGAPGNLFIPESLLILQTAFRSSADNAREELFSGDGLLHLAEEENVCPSALRPCPELFWENVDERLQRIVQLPVRKKLSPGPVKNVVLRKALAACRDYWLTKAKLRWSMSSLKQPEIRHEKVPGKFQGRCERFVADILEQTGLRFGNADLAAAWAAVDLAARR